jgi:hypothetical protein
MCRSFCVSNDSREMALGRFCRCKVSSWLNFENLDIAQLFDPINPLAQLLFSALADKPVAPFWEISPVVFGDNSFQCLDCPDKQYPVIRDNQNVKTPNRVLYRDTHLCCFPYYFDALVVVSGCSPLVIKTGSAPDKSQAAIAELRHLDRIKVVLWKVASLEVCRLIKGIEKGIIAKTSFVAIRIFAFSISVKLCSKTALSVCGSYLTRQMTVLPHLLPASGADGLAVQWENKHCGDDDFSPGLICSDLPKLVHTDYQHQVPKSQQLS